MSIFKKKVEVTENVEVKEEPNKFVEAAKVLGNGAVNGAAFVGTIGFKAAGAGAGAAWKSLRNSFNEASK